MSDFVVLLQVLDLNEMAFTWSLAQYGKGAPRPKGIYEVHQWAKGPTWNASGIVPVASC